MIINNEQQSQSTSADFMIAGAEVSRSANYPLVVYSTKTAAVSQSSTEDKEKPKSEFELALDKIADARKALIKRAETFERNSRKAAAAGLALIIGIHNTFFKDAPEQEKSGLEAQLRSRLGIKRNKKTTIFHMLSRVYRGDDTRQASGDAKVLALAVKDGIDESRFVAWVDGKGGLDSIKKDEDDREKLQRKPREQKKPNAKVLWGRASAAINALIENGQMSDPFSFDESDWPELCAKVRPDYENYCSVVLVNHANGEIHFRKLESFEPFTPAYEHKHFDGVRVQHVVNVDGTDADTWPECIVKKSGGAKENIEESESTDKAPD